MFVAGNNQNHGHKCRKNNKPSLRIVQIAHNTRRNHQHNANNSENKLAYCSEPQRQPQRILQSIRVEVAEALHNGTHHLINIHQ